MKTSEILKAIASWLENPNNEALILAENDETSLESVATSCLVAANELRKAASEVEVHQNKLTPEALDELSSLASAFDASGDQRLEKQASAIDQLLLAIAATGDLPGTRQDYLHGDMKDAHQKFIERNLNERPDQKKIADAEKAIEESGATKEYRVLEAPLSSRS